jgi:arsenate reductase-like glutaredoxin family protein
MSQIYKAIEDLKKVNYKTDPIVESVIKQFKKRSEVGIKKYGTTLAENNTDDFLQHLKEELMDAILYLQKLQDGTK